MNILSFLSVPKTVDGHFASGLSLQVSLANSSSSACLFLSSLFLSLSAFFAAFSSSFSSSSKSLLSAAVSFFLFYPDSGTTKEELSTLNKLYKEGFITEEEFSKAKSILLNPDSGTTKKEEKKWWQWPDEEMEEKRKAVILKKQKLTAVERRDLEELEKEELKAEKHVEKKPKLTAAERRDLEEMEKEELKAAKEAERERKSEERKRKAEEEELARQTCKDNPEVKCPSTVLGTLKKLNIFKKN